MAPPVLTLVGGRQSEVHGMTNESPMAKPQPPPSHSLPWPFTVQEILCPFVCKKGNNSTFGDPFLSSSASLVC